MATVHLSVPHLSRTLQRGERVVLQDVLRVERAGDDLLAWVRQVEGSIQLQRLQNFYLPDQDAVLVLESTQIGDAPQYLTAQTALPSTVLEEKAPDAVVAQDDENDLFWVQSLASDLAHVDAAFLHDGAASGLSQSSVLSGVYRTLDGADVKAWEPLTESEAQTIDKQTLLPGPVDTVPPVAPTIDLPMAMVDGFINRSEALEGVLLQGTAEAGSTVMLRWSQGTGSMTVTADAQGRWQYLASYADVLNAKMTSGKTFLLAKSVDASGLVSPDAGRELEIRLSQPSPPTAELDDPMPTRWSATATSDVTPAFSGVGPVNGKVVWYLDRNGNGLTEASERLAEASTDSAGHYNLTLPSLAAGQTHALLAVAVDRFGNASATSTPIALAVDTSPPALPTLDSVTGDNAISLAEQQAGVVFLGTGEAGAKVFIQRQQGGETLVDEVVVGPQGIWTLTIAADNWGQIATGSVDVQVRQVDPAGNASGWTSALPVTVTLVPAVPSDLAISSDTGADTTDGLTATAQQVISGRAVAGSTVTVFDDRDNDGVLDVGESLQVVTADANTGVFQTTSLNFAQGEYQLRAFANVGGQLSGASPVKRMKVDTDAPVITMTKAADVVTGTGLINVAKQASGTRFEGAAENGLQVSLSFKDANNQALTHNGQALVYTTTATAGSWAIVLTSAQLATLAAAGQGAFTAEVRQTDGAGNTGTATRSVTVDTIAPAGVRSQQATALSLQSAGELSGGVDWSDVVDDGQVLVPVALPDNLGVGGSLRLNWGGQFVTHTITNAEVAQGYAQVAVSVDVLLAAGPGSKAVSVVFTDAASNASVPMPVTADALGTSVVAVDFSSRPPVIQLAQDSYHRQVAGTYHSHEVQGVTVWVSGVAGSTVALSEGSTNLGSVQLDAYGLGSTVLQLTPGLHTLSAQATGTLTSSLRIMIDNVRPAAPTVTALADYLNDDLVNARERDGQVQIRGTCESGYEVSYWLYNTLTGVASDTVTVTSSGTNWTAYISLEQWFQVGDGTLQLNVRQIDFAGNVSDTVETILTLDALALAPVVDPVAGDDRINGLEQGQVVLRGAAEPGATVSLLLQGALGTVSKTLSANATTGAWTQGLTSSEWAQLGEGNIRLTATQTDRAGNVSTSTVRNLTLDTAARDLSVNAFAGDNQINLAETQLDQTLSGLGEAGATITIELGSLVARTATVSSNGRWSTSFTAAELQGLGSRPDLKVMETDLAGNTASQTRTLSVNTAPLSVQPSLTSPVSVLWSAQVQPLTLTGSGPTNTRVYLHLVGSRGAVDLGPAEVVNGHWSLTLTSAQMRTVLGAGDVSVQLWASSADGAQSSQVVPGSFVLQSEVPSPSLLVVAEDDTINLAEKQAGVVIEGTGVAGHTVALTLTRGSASRHLQTQVAANGTWRVSLTDADYAALGEGVVSLAVKQVFNGLESLTVSSTITVDTTPPAAPTSAAQTAATAANAASELAGGITALEAVNGVPVVLPLPANAAVGDRIEIFWGSSTEAVLTHVVRASDLQANAQTLTLTVPGEEIALLGSAANLSVTYRVTDAAGNADVLRTAVSGLNVSAPPQAPQFNAVMTDGYVNQQEYNQAPITLTGQVSGSGTLSLRLTGSNSQVLDLTPTVTAGSWSLTLSAAQLDSLGEGTIGMQATQVVSGVTSPTATGSFVFDKTLPASVTAARIQAALERNVDTELSGGLLATVSNNNLTEAYDGTVLYVPLAADAVAGDSLRVFWGSQQGSGGVQVDVSLTLTDVQRGYAAVTISEGVITQVGDNANLRVEAQTVDRAGNAGARYEAWTGPVDAVPAMPTLQAVTPDNILNITEMAGTLTVSGFADAGRSVQVRLVKGFDTIAQTVMADVVSGAWSWTLSAAQKSQLAAWGQGALEAQARQVDGTGNPSQWQVATVTVDTVAPTPPVVNVVAGDDRISRSEALSASGVRLSGTGEAGASVVLTFKNGSTALLTKGGITVNSSGEWEAVLNAADFASFPSNTGSAGVNLSVSAVQTDAAGNPSGAASKGFVYSDDVVNAPAGLTVQDVADQYFNAADGSTGLQISGTGDAGRWVRVRVTVGDVVTDLPVVQVAPDGSWRATVTGAALTALGQGAATVQAVQRNGSGIHADESSVVTYGTAFVIDTVVPALQSAVLAVEDSAGQPRAHAKVGDVLLIKIRLSEDATLTAGTSDPTIDLGAGLSGDAVYDATRSAALGSQWLVFKYVVQANDSALEGAIGASGFTVNWNGAALQDVAGNPLAMNSITPQTHGIRVDTLAPAAPAVVGLVAADANTLAADLAGSVGGDKVNVAELSTGKALLKVSLGSGVLANDQLEVQFSWTAGGAQTYTSQTTLLASDVANGFAVLSLPVQALSGLQGVTDLSAQARVVDVAGNASGWSAPIGSWDLDTVAPAAPSIPAVATDNRMSASERAALSDITLTGLEAGASVEAWIEGLDSTQTLVTRTLTLSNGTISAAALNMALTGLADGTWTFKTRQTDTAGNVSETATRAVAMDTDVPGNPVMTVAAASDAWVNVAETSAGLSMTVDLRNTRTKVGDALAFSWGSHSYNHVLSAGQPDTLLTLVLPASFVSQSSTGPATGEAFDLSVKIVDTGGNESASSSLSGKTLDTLIAAPAISAASLDTVTALEAKSAGTFAGSGAEAGATVVVVLTSSTTGQVRRMSTLAGNDGTYSFALTPSDYKDLGGTNASSTINVSVTQTDRAGNTSAASIGSFRLDLSLAPPTFFDLTGDNLISDSEANAVTGQVLKGTGSPGASVQIQFFDASAGAGAPALLTLSSISVNASTGRWETTITSAQFITLAGGVGGSRAIRAVAIQELGGSTSDPGTLQFEVDMTTPTITSLTRFDANGDGGNNDGLLLTLSEPVKASRMTLLSAYSVGAGGSLGSGARIETIDAVTANGSTYSQKYRIYLGNGHTLSGNETLSLLSGNVEDLRGNNTTNNLTAIVPSLTMVGRPIPPLVVALDNVISGSEASGSFNIPFTIPATQSSNSVLRFFINGVQTQVAYNGSTVLDVPLTSTQTTVNLSVAQANWGTDGSKTIMAQVVVDPGTANERSSLFSSSKIALLDTSVDGLVQSMVLVQHDGDGLLESGEKIRLTFKESVKLGSGTISAAFGIGAFLSPVASINGLAQQWDVTLGSNPTLTPGQSYGMSGGVLKTGVRYVMVRNNPSPTDALSFSELIVLDASGNNIAKGKNTTASSSYNTQYDKSKVVDGDATGSETSSWGGATTGDQWIQVDLGQTYDINAIVIVPRNSFGEGKSFTVFAGSSDMSTQAYGALTANGSLFQYNYSSSTALSSPLVLGQAVVAIDAAGNIAGAVSVPLPLDLLSIPQVGYIDAVSTDNVLSASDMLAATIDVKVVLKSAQVGDVVKLYMDGQEVGARTLLASDITTGSVNLSVNASDWGADGERMLQTTVQRGTISSELSVARTVYVQADHAHWSLVRDASAIWFDPDNLASQGLGAAVTDWRSSAGGSTASNSDVNQRPTLIMVNGHYALNFDGTNDNLNYTDPLSIIPKASNATVGYDISGFVAIQSQTASGGFRSALSYWGDTPGSGVARGVKLGIANTQLTYTTYSLLDFYGPSNSVSPNSTTVLTLRDYYDSSALAYRMQGYNLNVQDINQTGNNSRINMTIAPTALRIGADTNYGIRAYWQGMIGDAIWLNYKVSDAQMFEIQTYLAAKYASVGFWVNQVSNGVYRLDSSIQSSPLIDQRVDFRSVVANETVKLAGADYVQTGRGDDIVQLKDLFFRYVDAGQGLDTLQWAVDYTGPSSVVLADFVSNMRGLSGNATDDARVNAAGYHELAGFERLDLRQIGIQSGAVETQVLALVADDVKQLSQSNQLEILLGNNDVLKTSGFSTVTYGNFTLNNQFYGAKHLGTSTDGTQVEVYVRGGRLAPDLEGLSLSGSAMQLDFNTALAGAAPLLGDFSINTWGGAVSGLSSVTSLNNRQSLYMEFSSAVSSPIQVVYNGSLKDEFGRSLGHAVWGLGTEGSDTLDASSWSATAGAAIVAGAGNDRVTGTANADLIVGGLGADTLTGGSGSDRFAYNTVNQGSGGTGGLGGTAGDVITDFNTSSNSTQADVLDLSDLFQLAPGDSLTGDAQHYAQTLVAGGYIDLVRVNSGKDLQVWVDRDGGDVMGQLVTLQDIGTGLGNYFSVPNESAEQLLQRLLTEGRMQVTHA